MAIQLTKDVEDFFGDGTFKSCPKQLPDKKEKTYEAMFQHFRRVFERMNGGNLENKTIHLDFEKAAHEAVKHVMPNFCPQRMSISLEAKLVAKYSGTRPLSRIQGQ